MSLVSHATIVWERESGYVYWVSLVVQLLVEVDVNPWVGKTWLFDQSRAYNTC